ncbi:hypothetical protein ACHAWF_016165 [Thalassiosira exigua]
MTIPVVTFLTTYRGLGQTSLPRGLGLTRQTESNLDRSELNRKKLTFMVLWRCNSATSQGNGDKEEENDVLAVPAVSPRDGRPLGCRLDPSASPSALRSSVRALLAEMRSNGIDPNNERVLQDLEGIVLGTTEGDDGDGTDLLRRMLLPLYRVRERRVHPSQFSQPELSQPDGDEGGIRGNVKVVAESSSLARVLLRVDDLQVALSTALLQRLPELACGLDDGDEEGGERGSGGGDSGAVRGSGGDDDLPRLILASLRWPDHVVDPTSLAAAYAECLTVLSSAASSSSRARGVLLDAIAALPDVLSDAVQATTRYGVANDGDEDRDEEEGGGSSPILATLRHLRSEDPTLLVPCLDALGSLPLDEYQIEEATRDALEALAGAEAWGLPALTAFLTTHCPGKGEMAVELVEEMRKLPLGVGGTGVADDDAGDRTDSNGSRNNGDCGDGAADSACLTVESLSRGLARRPDLASTLLRVVKAETSRHPPADVWLLACCASAPHLRPKAKSLFKAKANAGAFGARLLREALGGNGRALGGLFAALCDLADGLLRSGGSSGSSFAAASEGGVGSGGAGGAAGLGVALYEILFREFAEPMQRQEIVGSLVTHVGSGLVGGGKVGGGSGEVDAALRAFCQIVEGDGGGAVSLRPFVPFLTSLLDLLSHMTTGQARRLFLLLFAVGSDGDEGGDGAGSSVATIVIQKHLTLAPFTKKRIGIIGTVAHAVSKSSQLLKQEAIIDGENAIAETEATCLPGSAAVASSPVAKEVQDMITSAYQLCQPGCASGDKDGWSAVGHKGMDGVGQAGDAFSDGAAAAFLLDELTRAVCGGRLAAPAREWLDDTFKEDFEERYVGDFVEPAEEDGKGDGNVVVVQRKGAEKGAAQGSDERQVPTNPQDLALLNGASNSELDYGGLRGELRFGVGGSDSAVYVRLLPHLLSPSRAARCIFPPTLSPMFRLMSALSDLRFGGIGLSEIDAMLECPLLMPDQDACGEGFEDLVAEEQWATTASCFFATCWVRQLINSFIYAAGPFGGAAAQTMTAAGSFTASSQGFNSTDVQKKVASRLKVLVELEEELRFTSSKCFQFAPPGLDVLPAPKELYDDGINSNGDNTENLMNVNIDPKNMSKEDKKALAAAKKMATRRAKEKVKSKQRRLKAKQKHEENLTRRTMGALRPLDPQVCVALGFADLSVMGGGADDEGSQGLSQMQVTTCGGPVHTLLLRLLQKALSDSLSDRKGSAPAFRARLEGGIPDADDDGDTDNPYVLKDGSQASTDATANFLIPFLTSCDESSRKSFILLDGFLRGGVFASLYEHLATVAELRCGANSSNADDCSEERLVETARCLFGCVATLMSTELLTRSSTGRMFLSAILKQIAEGDRDDYCAENKRRRRPTSSAMNKLLFYVVENVNEIITGAYTGDIEFAMDGVNCMQAILECSKRVSDADVGSEGDAPGFQSKLSEVADKLLRQDWPDDTKLNRGNVGKLLSLLVEHSPNRKETLSNLVKDVLLEVPHLDKGKGVPAFPTCSCQTFGIYFSTCLEYLSKELSSLFDSPGSMKEPEAASRIIELMKEITGLLQALFDLTKHNDALAKKTILLQQLKFGSRFLETFVSKAIPFFQIHFQHSQDEILEIIRLFQKWSRQLYHIISHGKREKDANLAKEAPRAKKALEMFIHKVKALLKKNRCMTAMWTATLKAKDIDGSTIKEADNKHGDDEGDDSASDDGESADEEDGSEEVDSEDTSENEYDTDDD